MGISIWNRKFPPSITYFSSYRKASCIYVILSSDFQSSIICNEMQICIGILIQFHSMLQCYIFCKCNTCNFPFLYALYLYQNDDSVTFYYIQIADMFKTGPGIQCQVKQIWYFILFYFYSPKFCVFDENVAILTLYI